MSDCYAILDKTDISIFRPSLCVSKTFENLPAEVFLERCFISTAVGAKSSIHSIPLVVLFYPQSRPLPRQSFEECSLVPLCLCG